MHFRPTLLRGDLYSGIFFFETWIWSVVMGLCLGIEKDMRLLILCMDYVRRQVDLPPLERMGQTPLSTLLLIFLYLLLTTIDCSHDTGRSCQSRDVIVVGHRSM